MTSILTQDAYLIKTLLSLLSLQYRKAVVILKYPGYVKNLLNEGSLRAPLHNTNEYA